MRILPLVFVIMTVIASCRATMRKERFHISKSVNDPDDPRFSLKNLADIFYQELDNKQGTSSFSRSVNLRKLNKTLRKLTKMFGASLNPFTITPRCDFKSEFRTIDGTCNNVRNPRRGAAKIPLRRLVRNAYQDGKNSARKSFFKSTGNLPTSRAVSKGIVEPTANLSSKHSHLMMGYGQFLDHDITISPEAGGEGGVVETAERCCDVAESQYKNDLRECFPIDVSGDQVFTQTSCIPFLRSAPVPPPPGAPFERYQLNDLSAYVDGGNVYGTTLIKSNALRSFVDGKLKISRGRNGEERLPLAPDNPANCASLMEDCRFFGGDVRNSEQAGLSSMHTLLVREHNRIATELLRLNPQWYSLRNYDQKIYETTRKIIGAILQRVTYREFLPEVVGPDAVYRYRLAIQDSGRFNGYSRTADASILTEFSTAAFRFGHSLIRQTFGAGTNIRVGVVQVFDAFKTVDTYGATALLNGLAKDATESFDRFFSEGIQDELFGMDLDLIALNIQRGRDHGIGSYMDVRRHFGLRTYTNYNDMIGVTHSLATINKLRAVYPTPVDIELFPGGVSEIPARGAIVGPVFANIIAVQFQRIKVGDRFWHETNDPDVKFTDAQLREIRKSSFAALYCENVPGVQVRDYLLLRQSASNPRKQCRDIARLDLSAWAESGSGGGSAPTTSRSTHFTRRITTTLSPQRPRIPSWCRGRLLRLPICKTG